MYGKQHRREHGEERSHLDDYGERPLDDVGEGGGRQRRSSSARALRPHDLKGTCRLRLWRESRRARSRISRQFHAELLLQRREARVIGRRFPAQQRAVWVAIGKKLQSEGS